jgi:hypothetical protein
MSKIVRAWGWIEPGISRDIQGSNTGECPIFMGKLWRKSLVERICLDYPLLDLTTRVGGNVFSTNELIESHFQH